MENLVLREAYSWGFVLKLNRPSSLNALNSGILAELKEELVFCEENNARVVVITGNGDRAFAAGADIAAMKDLNPQEARDFSLTGQDVMNFIARMKAVVIAAVNGYALGGGCELAMACDFRIASSKAKFGVPEVSLGVIPGFGGTQRLPRLVGIGKAIEMMATGKVMDAQEAFLFGLVNMVTQPDELMQECCRLAERIEANSVLAVALGKQSILSGAELDLQKGLEYEAGLFAMTFSGEDQKEGMSAFLEKRKANFCRKQKPPVCRYALG